MKIKVDIRITGDGFYSITGASKRGSSWINRHVDGASGAVAFTDDTRMAADIAEGATAAGLFVTVHEYQYLAGGARGQKVAA